MEQEKQDLWRRFGFSLLYSALGRQKEADATLLEFVKNYRDTAAYQIGEIYPSWGEVDRAFEWLERPMPSATAGSQIKR